MNVNVKISGAMYSCLKDHLFPGDGKEAVAIALCGRHEQKNQKWLYFYKLVLIPYDQCEIREPDLVQWSTSILEPHLSEAMNKGLAIVKIHSHPTGYPKFSGTDDRSDLELFDSMYGWIDHLGPHASLIMLPGGELFGRTITPDLKFGVIDRIALIIDDLKFWSNEKRDRKREEFNRRTEQALGKGTTDILSNLNIGVVGCSGTGSPVIEQLVRLGVGSITLVDPDRVEEKNLNRILNTRMEDAKKSRYKVDVIKASILSIGLGTKVRTFRKNMYDDIDVVNSLASCDFIFGCVDSVDGRHLVNQISTFYLVPYIDLGVKIIADGQGGINQICGTIHYIQPGKSSLKTRGLYTFEELRAAGLYRTNVNEYEKQKKSGYITNINVDSPAVISINMQVASMAINEFLARIHPFRYSPNSDFAITRFSVTDSYVQTQSEEEEKVDEYLVKYVGRGSMLPLLNMPELD